MACLSLCGVQMRREIGELEVESAELQKRRQTLKEEAEGSTDALLRTAKQIQESLGGVGSAASKVFS